MFKAADFSFYLRRKTMDVLTCHLFLLMTLISCSVCQDQTIIKAKPGENVTLPCKGSENNPVTFVKLTRADLDPEYVLVYRDDIIYEQFQNPRFKGRIELQSFNSSDGNVNVTLINVKEGDNGTYECFVKSDTNGPKTRRKRATSERIIQLNLVPPGKEDGDMEDGGINNVMDIFGNSRSHVIPACAGMILTVLIVAVAIIIRKNKKMSSPPDEAQAHPMI